MNDFTGTVVWVTGASRGLGRAAARWLASRGAKVAMTARDESRLDALATEIGDQCGYSAGEAVPFPGSVADPARMAQIVASITALWGRVDVLVNNAGISPSLTPSAELGPADWQDVLDVNLSGAFYCAQAASGAMVDTGSIINVSSVHASVGMPRIAAYAASKGGLEALTRVLALEWADRGIRVNALAPGYVETDMTAGLRAHDGWRQRLLDATPAGRFATEDDLLPAIGFLASNASAYMTGATLTIDGGWTAR